MTWPDMSEIAQGTDPWYDPFVEKWEAAGEHVDTTFIPLSQKDVANGVAVLDSGGKIALARLPQGANALLVLDGSGLVPSAALPPLAINETFVVADQAARLALTAQRGDMAIQTDNGKTYVLATDSPSTNADWKEVLAAGQVVSVNGQTGVVVIGIADITGLQGALDAKADTSSLGTAAAADTGDFDAAGDAGAAVTGHETTYDHDEFISEGDSRLTDDRDPNAHAASHGDGGADEITIAQSQVTDLVADLGGKIPASEKAAALGVATLDAGGQIPAGQIPAIAVTSFLGVAANQAAMLALTGQEGDWCTRSDTQTVFVITGADPTLLAGWTELTYPAAPVVSVNGETGVVVLDAGDVGAATAAQGSTADSAVQPGDLGAVATSNDYGDLDNLPTLPTALEDLLAPSMPADEDKIPVVQPDGTFALETPGGGSGETIHYTEATAAMGASTRPVDGLGADGDYAIINYDGGNSGNRHHAAFVGPKAAGVWPATIGTRGDKIVMPMRSLSMVAASLIPGWEVGFQGSWCTGTVPADMKRDGTFGGTSFQSNASGNYVGLTRFRANEGAASLGSLAFFSGAVKIGTLPEASRFAFFGQFGMSGQPWGYGARIDSFGAVSLVIVDFSFTVTVLDSGMTISAGDRIIVERFANRMSIYRVPSGGWAALDADAAAASRPLNALVGPSLFDSYTDYYASLIGGSSFGWITNSTSVRASEMKVSG
jgi:hypothetical protein